jgi:hypothetical protein
MNHGNGQGQGQEMRRSRSRSIDPALVRPDVPKRPMIRAPSGKDLFKGREVGLMRRTGSRKEMGIRREDSQSHPSIGLLGRKTSDPKRSKPTTNGTLILISSARPLIK